MQLKDRSAAPGRALAGAIGGAFLFALGGVGTWVQEYAVWVPHWVASLLIRAGLTLGLAAVALAAWLLFTRPPLERPALRQVAWSLFFGALPPVVFLAWAVWLRMSLAGPA